MYLHTLRLENVKLLAEFEIDFTTDGVARPWTVLLGDNGVCKTSILQAIALLASGDKLARALVRDGADYARATTETVRLAAVFESPREGESLRVEMRVEPGSHAFDGHGDAARINDIRSKRTPNFFVVGYGVGRYLPRPGEVAVSTDPVFDRVEGLFDSRHKMLGVDFFAALKKQSPKLARDYAARIRDVLISTDPTTGDRLLPWLANVELRGQGGVERMESLLESQRFELEVGPRHFKLAPHQLSQGYQSIIAWISDLLGHAFLERGEDVDPATLEGIVLLDEIDLHLHPTWQRRVVPILRGVFPRLQFIVTTHSPLVLTGFDATEILRLEMDEDGLVRVRPTNIEPAAQSASQLLTTYFDVPVAARPEVFAKEREYLALKGIAERTAHEESKLAQLATELRPYLRAPLRDPRRDPATLALEDRIRAMEARVDAASQREDEP